MNALRVNICIPAFNAVGFIADALASVGIQTFRDWQITVVEDGSDDGTKELVDAFSRTVPQTVRYIRHERNRGLPATRNTAMHASGAEFIALLDADDLWREDHLESSVRALEAAGADLACAASELFESDTGHILEVRMPSESEIELMPVSLYRRNFMQPSAVVFRREVFDRVGGFDESLRSCEDLEYWFQMLRAGCQFIFTGLPTCRYRKHSAAMTGNAFRMAVSLAAVREKHLDWVTIPYRIRMKETAGAFGSAGRIARRVDPEAAKLLFNRAWKLDPWQPQWLAGIVVCEIMMKYLRGHICQKVQVPPSSSETH